MAVCAPQSDWEESEEEEQKPAAAPEPPKKKKLSVKQKIAEKEAQRAASLANGTDGDQMYDEDAVLDPRSRAKRDKERELESDLRNAADLFSSASISGKLHR